MDAVDPLGRIELRHLRHFVAVAEELHFRRAAERLHMAQPPLSQSVRRLEETLGVELLLRTTRAVELTPAGRVLLGEARELLQSADAALRRVRAAAQTHVVRVGHAGSYGPNARRLAQRFLAEHPQMDVVQRELHFKDIPEAVGSGDIDVAVTVLPFDGSVPPEFECAVLFERQVFVALPAGHPLVALDVLEPGDLRADALVALNTPAWQVTALYSAIGVEADGLVAETFQGMMDAVADGAGYALTSASSYSRDNVVFRPLDGVTIASGLLWAAGDRPEAVSSFIDTARLSIARRAVLEDGSGGVD